MPSKGTGAVSYRQVAADLARQVGEGVYAPGEKLPSERALCDLYSVSRITIRHALSGLVSQGLVTSVAGKGNFVAVSTPPKGEVRGAIAFVRCRHSLEWTSVTGDVFYQGILSGAEMAGAKGGSVCIYSSLYEDAPDEAILRSLTGKVDGIVACEVRGEAFLERLTAAKVPVVLVSSSLDSNSVDSVEIDNRRGSKEAVKHLVSLGHTRIAHIGGPQASRPASARRLAYAEAMAESGLATPSGCAVARGWRLEDGYDAMQALLCSAEATSAVFAASDLLALGALQATVATGLAVPGDISIVGFDDIALAAQSVPGLTTARVPLVDMGKIAVDLLRQKTEGDRTVSIKVTVPVELVVRDSTAVPRR